MFRTLSVTTALTISMLAALAVPACAVQNDGPFPNIKAAPLAAVWQYSNDGGKTFVDKPLPAPPPGGRGSNHPYAWKATFDVPDPSQIAGLWVRLVEEHPFPLTPRASICNGDLDEAAGGYWKDLGYHPCLLGASIVLNGKEAKFANGPVLYFWVPLEGELRRGQNALEMRGNVYSYWGARSTIRLPRRSTLSCWPPRRNRRRSTTARSWATSAMATSRSPAARSCRRT